MNENITDSTAEDAVGDFDGVLEEDILSVGGSKIGFHANMVLTDAHCTLYVITCKCAFLHD